ncbi:hypothetical protein CFOL_v3_11307 [Cephalotus follicularis]|uniref:Uncharacterized protein n=1 Tax=Cephalotus follicularis TaxID=3775 RepID=A0A1Q3BJ86_CEPFO|nr:hypothetical protein CFOL_v3_11307 [Cephalotus follicularis]
MEENGKLKFEIDALKKSFSIFSNSSAKLDNLLGLQRCVFDKAGLGYEEMKNVKHFNNFFVKKFEPKIVYNYCGRIGHISTSCIFINNIYCGKTRKIWVPKGTLVLTCKDPNSNGYQKLKLCFVDVLGVKLNHFKYITWGESPC